MAAITRQYAQDEVSLMVGNVAVTELSEDGISLTFDEDRIVVTQGSHRSVAVAKRSDEVGEMTISVMPTSPTNGALGALIDQYVPVLLRDNLGTTIISVPRSRMLRRPDMDLGQERDPIEWTLKLFNPDVIFGQSLPA